MTAADRMKWEEAHVKKHLIHCGYNGIIYEPDGKGTTPDFLVNDNIAVEVRRLNANHFSETGTDGLEQAANKLETKLHTLLEEFGPPKRGESWWVFYRFSRPLGGWRATKKAIQRGLQDFVEDIEHSRRKIISSPALEVEILCKTTTPKKSMFVLAGRYDENSGGLLLELMEANIQYCIEDKTNQTREKRTQYEQWWLALVDTISGGMDDFERDLFRTKVSVQHDFEKVLIIDGSDHRLCEEL